MIETTFFIKRRAIQREDNKDYLIRYSLPTASWMPFSIKIHKILLSDDDCLHDHPWKFFSLILSGGYFEYTPPVDQHKIDLTRTYNGVEMIKKWHGPMSFLVRPAHWIHRLELKEGNPTWTFVITFKKTKDWGFFTKNGFINWMNYDKRKHC